MKTWSLAQLLDSLHADVQHRLQISRDSFGHPGTKGDATEGIWLELLNAYLPKRYSAESAHVVDSDGTFSEQIDVVVFDRQYSPFIFQFEGQKVIPAESVYAVFESKQSLNAGHVAYTMNKVTTVRRLKRTSLPIPHAGGEYPPKSLFPILGGLLTFESDWQPPLGETLLESLRCDDANCRLDLGCVAAHGYFSRNIATDEIELTNGCKPATGFLFKLIEQLQFMGTVPMIDISAYGRWLH